MYCVNGESRTSLLTVPYCHGDSESKGDFLSLTELNGTIHQLEKKLENFEHLRQECSGKAIHIQVTTYAVLYYSLHPTRISPAYSTVLTVYSDVIHSFDWKSAVEHDSGV